MDETPWLDDTQRLAWVRFAAVLELLPRALDAQLERDEHLTHYDYYCLAMLSEAPDRTLRMTVLASMTNATLPRLSRVMNRLEDAGYVRREQCPGDRRATNLVLTDDGWNKVVRSRTGSRPNRPQSSHRLPQRPTSRATVDHQRPDARRARSRPEDDGFRPPSARSTIGDIVDHPAPHHLVTCCRGDGGSRTQGSAATGGLTQDSG